MATIGFRIDPGEYVDYPNVTVLVDGVDVIGAATDFIGFDPADLFDSGALVPEDVPRRVAVYRCNCGEAGCGCAAPIIERSGDLIRWHDFRDFVGVYVKPTIAVEPDSGRSLPIADIEFDADDYLRAVADAAADRSWETRPRRIARLLLTSLRDTTGWWGEREWQPHWVSPVRGRPDLVRVAFRRPSGQLIVELPIDSDLGDGDLIRAAVEHLADRAGVRVLEEREWPPRSP